MSPEHLASNMWRLLKGEYIEGIGGRIDGPAIVRVHEYPEVNSLYIQGSRASIELEGLDFSSHVQKEVDNKM